MTSIIKRKTRDDYRALSTTQLLEAVDYDINPDWQELAIALAERLRVKQNEVLDYRYARAYGDDY